MGMRRLLFKIFLLFLLPLLILEAHKRSVEQPKTWYALVEDALKDDEWNIFFVGSSRTGAAIDAGIATRILRMELKRPVHVYNMGAGYTTLAENYLGLQSMIRHRP